MRLPLEAEQDKRRTAKPNQPMTTENDRGHTPDPDPANRPPESDPGGQGHGANLVNPLTDERCADCGAALVEDQRYCLQCGARRGLPRLDFTAYWKVASPSDGGASDSTASSGGEDAWETQGSRQASWSGAPSRRLGALLLAAVLAGGIVAGAALGPSPPNSPADSSTLAERALAAVVAGARLERTAIPASAPSAASASAAAANSPASAGTPAPEPPAPSKHGSASSSASSASGASSGNGGPESGSPESASPEGGSSEGSSSEGSSKSSEAAPGTPVKLPPIKHVWLISLSGTNLIASATKDSSGSYLRKQLLSKGALLSGYKLTAPSALANGIAVLSGQGVNLDTEQNCPTYSDIQPPTVSSTGLAEGVGCVYPAPVQTLADELTAAGLTWKAYIQDMEGSQSSSTAAAGASTPATASPGAASPANPTAGSPAASPAASCRHPELGAPDPDQTPAPGAPYLTYRNPFVYFHSLLDAGACAADDVDYTHLQSDLAAPSSTPSLSWIVPSACDDGSATPCSPGAPSGLAPAESFLEEVVPRILATAAYREGGLIAILPDSGPLAPGSGGPTPSTGGPGEPGSAAAKPVGALLLSPFVRSGERVSESLNDFSLLKSLSRLFGVLPLGHAHDPSVASLGAAVYGSSGKAAKTASTAKKAAQAAPTHQAAEPPS